jgi:MATE family multidrug resistance protein
MGKISSVDETDDAVVEVNFETERGGQKDLGPAENEIEKSPLISHAYCSEVQSQLYIAFPVLVTFFLRKSVDIISVMFVGRLGSLYLSSAGIATVTANVTGFSMVVGLAGAISTLCSQAHGSKDAKTLSTLLQKAILILVTFICIPVSILWFMSEHVMIRLGQTPAIASAASKYLMMLVPSLWAVAGTLSLQNWLHSQSKTHAVLAVTFTVTLLHPCWCYLFIYAARLGYLGAAMAVSMSKILELSLLLTYTHMASLDTGLSVWCTWDTFRGWWPFLRLGLPNMVMMSEWWASEIIIFMAGTLANPENQVSAMSIYQSTLSICFMIPSSFQVSAATRVGNALGGNDPYAANLAATVAPMMAAISSVLLSFVLFSLKDRWGFIFTTDAAVVAIVESVLPIVLIYIVADGIQSALTGVLKGVGKQKIGGPIVVFSYYAVGLPVSYLLAFRGNFGVIGLCVGTTVGTAIHMLLYLMVVLRTNWPYETRQVQKRMRRATFQRQPPACIQALGDGSSPAAGGGYDSGDDDENTWWESIEDALSGLGLLSGGTNSSNRNNSSGIGSNSSSPNGSQHGLRDSSSKDTESMLNNRRGSNANNINSNSYSRTTHQTNDHSTAVAAAAHDNGSSSLGSSLYKMFAKAVGIKVGPSEYELVHRCTDSLVSNLAEDEEEV